MENSSSTPGPSLDSILRVELTRMVCSFLPTKALQELRLVSKIFAELGAEFLIPEVHLVFTTGSIKRLKDISIHTVYSQHVRSLLYEADRLNYYENERQWLNHVHDYFWGACGPPPLPLGNDPASREAQRVTRNRWITGPKHSYSKQQLDEGWKKFQALFLEQEVTATHEMDISAAVARFPKLHEVRISIEGKISKQSEYLKKSFTGGLVGPTGPYRMKDLQPPGFNALRSVLLGFTSTERHSLTDWDAQGTALLGSTTTTMRMASLTTLHLGSVNPFLFTALYSNFSGKTVHERFKSLRDVKIVINMRDYGDYAVTTESQESINVFGHGHLLRFLTEATNLKRMSITCARDCSDWIEIGLACVLGNNTWELLEEITLSGFKTDHVYFLDFLQRHQQTLECISLKNFAFTASDDNNLWAQILLDIRNMKQWRDVTFYGHLFRFLPNDSEGTSRDGYFFAGFREPSLTDANTLLFQALIRSFALRKERWNPFVHFWRG